MNISHRRDDIMLVKKLSINCLTHSLTISGEPASFCCCDPITGGAPIRPVWSARLCYSALNYILD